MNRYRKKVMVMRRRVLKKMGAMIRGKVSLMEV